MTIFTKRTLSNLLLGLFLFLCAAIAFDVLIYWCVPLRDILAEVSPRSFFVMGFAYFLQGPMLYWYTKSLLYRDYRWKHRSEEHTSELQSRENLVCRLLLEKKNTTPYHSSIHIL